MINPKKHWCSLIDITNKCNRNCTYCTRYDRHVQPISYIIDLDYFEKALISYKGFINPIGIIGGEPLILPDFNKYCDITRKHFLRNQCVLFTSIDPAKNKFKEDIEKTFGIVAYHPHTKEQEASHYHQPLTIAIKDVIKNEKLKNDLINDCWCERRWCGTITNKGGYFCEVGAAIAQILNVPGWEIKSRWWDKEPSEFGYQRELCEYCGMCIPIELQLMSDKKQKMSVSVMQILRERNLPLGDCELFVREITLDDIKKAVPNWHPGKYKDEQMLEKDEFTTIDWSKYEKY
jgi:hypothetical protein